MLRPFYIAEPLTRVTYSYRLYEREFTENLKNYIFVLENTTNLKFERERGHMRGLFFFVRVNTSLWRFLVCEKIGDCECARLGFCLKVDKAVIFFESPFCWYVGEA